MDQLDVGYGHLDLVALQMTDEMPLYVLGQGEGLFLEFLGTALAEDPLARFVGLEYLLPRLEFGHCHELDPGGQFLPQRQDILSNVSHSAIYFN